MDELAELREKLHDQRPAAWDQLPDLQLYMDQVLSYMDRQVLRFEEDDGLTAAMVNNYTKSGLLPRAEGKKYNREHLAYLTAICILKRVMSVKDMGIVLGAELDDGREMPEVYENFRESLDKSLNLITDIMEAYQKESDATDAVVHFALLSYAAGLASDRFLSILRKKQAAQESAAKTEKNPKRGKRSKQDPAE